MAKINVPNSRKYESSKSPNRIERRRTHSRNISSAGERVDKTYQKVIGVAIGVGLAGLLLFGWLGAILGAGIGWYIGARIK